MPGGNGAIRFLRFTDSREYGPARGQERPAMRRPAPDAVSSMGRVVVRLAPDDFELTLDDRRMHGS